jgi:CHAD domain-containing protein
VIGELRDADVFIKDIYGPVPGLMKGHGGLPPLREALTAHRIRKRDAARANLDGTHWSSLQLYLALWPRTLEEVTTLDQPVAKFADHALDAIWKKVAKLGQRVSDLEGDERHKMRKSLKKLRYTIEYFASLYKPADVKPFVQQLKKLQDVFGYVNDVVTAKQLDEISEEHCPESLPWGSPSISSVISALPLTSSLPTSLWHPLLRCSPMPPSPTSSGCGSRKSGDSQCRLPSPGAASADLPSPRRSSG